MALFVLAIEALTALPILAGMTPVFCSTQTICRNGFVRSKIPDRMKRTIGSLRRASRAIGRFRFDSQARVKGGFRI